MFIDFLSLKCEFVPPQLRPRSTFYLRISHPSRRRWIAPAASLSETKRGSFFRGDACRLFHSDPLELQFPHWWGVREPNRKCLLHVEQWFLNLMFPNVTINTLHQSLSSSFLCLAMGEKWIITVHHSSVQVHTPKMMECQKRSFIKIIIFFMN